MPDQAVTITHTDPQTGEVDELSVEDAAELAADLDQQIAEAQDVIKRASLELGALRGQLKAHLGPANPVTLYDGRRVVFTEAKAPPRRVHPGACVTHRDALLRIGAVTRTTETVTTYSTPKVSDLEAPAIRAALAAEGIAMSELLVAREPELEMHVIPAEAAAA